MKNDEDPSRFFPQIRILAFVHELQDAMRETFSKVALIHS